MGHYTDQIEESGGRKNAMTYAGKTEAEIRKFILSRIPGHRFPDADERQKLTELNRKAWRAYINRNRRLHDELPDAQKTYERYHPNLPVPEIDRQEFQQLDVEAGNLGEQISEALEVTAAGINSPEFRKHQMKAYLRMEKMFTEEPGLFDPDQSDEKLVENYGKIMMVLAPMVKERSYFDELEQTMLAQNELSDEEEAVLAALKAHFQHLTNLNTIFNNRYEMIMNPLYPYLGEAFRNQEKMSALFNGFDAMNDDDELMMWDEYKAGQSTAGFYADACGKEAVQQALSAFGNQCQIYCPKFGTTESDFRTENNAVEYNITRCRNESADEFYARANDNSPWTHYIRNEHGYFVSQPAGAQESDRITRAHQSALPMDGVREEIRRIQNDPDGCRYVFYNTNFEKLPETPSAARQISDALSKGGAGIFAKSKDGQTYYHFYRMVDVDNHTTTFGSEVITKEMFDQALSSSVDRQMNERYGVDEPQFLNLKKLHGDLLKAQKQGPEQSLEALHKKAEEFRERLNRETHVLNSSDAYRRVQRSVNDFIDASYVLTPDEQRMMLKSISMQAQKYLSGKTEQQRADNTYTADRMNVMEGIVIEINRISAIYDEMAANRHPMETRPEAMDHDTRVSVMRSLRRSMHDQPFDADRFAELLAMESFGEREQASPEARNAKKAEIVSSAPVSFMKEHLTGQVANSADLKKIRDVTEEVLNIVGQLKRADDDTLLREFQVLNGQNHRDFVTGHEEYDGVLREELMNQLREEIRHRDIELNIGGNPIYGSKGHRMPYQRRVRVMHVIGEDKAENLIRMKQVVETENNRTVNALAQAVFGTNYAGAVGIMCLYSNENNGRSRTFVLLTAALMEKGLSIDDILDPEKCKEEKRALGDEIRADLMKGPDEAKTYTEESLIELAVKHAAEMNDYQQEIYNAVDLSKPESVKEYGRKAAVLRDGVWDVVCQIAHQTVRQEDLRKRKGDEALKNYQQLSEVIDFRHKAEPMIETELKAETDVLEMLHRQETDAEVHELDTEHLKALLGMKLVLPELKKIAGTGMTSDELDDFRVCLDGISGAAFHALDGLADSQKAMLLMDPALKDRISITIDKEFFRGLSKDEVVNVSSVEMQNGFRNMLTVQLTLDDGTKHVLSGDVLAGNKKPQGAEKDFLDRFGREISNKLDEKETQAETEISDKRTEYADSLPAALGDEIQLYSNHTELFEEIRDVLHQYIVKTRESDVIGDGDPYDYILIGGRKASEIVNREAREILLGQDQMTDDVREFMLAGIALAAMLKGDQVRAVRNIDDITLESAVTAEIIPAPAGLEWIRTSRAVSESVRNIRFRMAGIQSVFGKNDIEADFNEAKRAAVFKSVPDLGKNTGLSNEDVNAVISRRDASQGALKAAIGKSEGTALRLSGSVSVSAATAVILIAYGIEQERLNHGQEPQIAGGSLGDLTSENARKLLEEAADVYRNLQKTTKTNSEYGRYLSSSFIANGLHYMNEHRPEFTNTKDYVISHWAEVAAKREILNKIRNLQNNKEGSLPELLKDTPVCTTDEIAGMRYMDAVDNMNKLYSGEVPDAGKGIDAVSREMTEVLFLSNQHRTLNQNEYSTALKTANLFQQNTAKIYASKRPKTAGDELTNICERMRETEEQFGKFDELNAAFTESMRQENEIRREHRAVKAGPVNQNYGNRPHENQPPQPNVPGANGPMPV